MFQLMLADKSFILWKIWSFGSVKTEINPFLRYNLMQCVKDMISFEAISWLINNHLSLDICQA